MLAGRVFNHLTMTWDAKSGKDVPIPVELVPQADSNGKIAFIDLFAALAARDRLRAAALARKEGE